MINTVGSKKIDIILPNMNKALKEVLKDATPKQLETLSSGKDLRSIMDGILKQSSLDNSNDKVLLNLVKNNPTLKNLGDVSTTIQALLKNIKDDKNPLPIEKVLKNFLVDIKDVKDTQLKQKFENSGVFLESRIKDLKSSQTELKNTLTSLHNTLVKSEFSSAKEILKDIRSLITTYLNNQNTSAKDLPQIKELANKQDLPIVAQKVQKIISDIRSADPMFSKQTLAFVDKLQSFTNPQNLSSKHNIKELFSNDLKAVLLQAGEDIAKSNNPNKTELLNNIDKLSLQIDNYQLQSHLSNSSSLYLPFSWDGMKEGKIELKKTEDKFYCDIDLKLKEYGELKFKLTMYEKRVSKYSKG